MLTIAVIGASGALGQEFTKQFAHQEDVEKVYTFSRSGQTFQHEKVSSHQLDFEDESALAKAAEEASQAEGMDLVLVTTGILHENEMMPEKSLKEITTEKLSRLYHVNTILPTMIMKHFLPHLKKDQKAIFAAISARVGSISDNELGGWYSYRASKAALNMLLKCASIELARKNKQAIIVGLHPGTVASNLSKPFQAGVAPDKLFTPEESVSKLINTLESLSPEDTGKCFAYDGKEIPA